MRHAEFNDPALVMVYDAAFGWSYGDRRRPYPCLARRGDLCFRSEDELRSSLLAAGYAVEQIYGGWNREPAEAHDGELLMIARG